MLRCTHIQCACLLPCLLAALAVRAARCARCPCARVSVLAALFTCSPMCSLCLPVCASADAWSTVDFFVRRPCAACLACPRVCSLCSPACVRLRAPVLAPLAVRAWPRPCVRPCAPARARVCGRARPCVCASARVACLLPLFASFYSPIMYILRRYARPARRVVRSAHSTANFFEIVFKPSISVQLSST